MTIHLSDDQVSRIQAAAGAAGLSPEDWAARELRRALRRRQIQAYNGPDADTIAWRAMVDTEQDAMRQDMASDREPPVCSHPTSGQGS
ncbi:hypothetical protein LO763_19930 [Glycomyces sp. A-F 0318]|uniref:hypothetical protein n=1 Tax=Glycomyces amatae TaxID=2881355 RepID=UPI001E3A2FE9|nr:hypothetical protein [Glycomyces amatae]MCD0445883.1 hypothetical protein [Glycomyces amatae]